MDQVNFKSHRKDIQVLRGIAVISVIAYHSSIEIFPNGYLGVDAFFVISSMLISTRVTDHLSAPNVNPDATLRWFLGFWRRRALRLGPALLVVVSASFLSSLILADFQDLDRIFQQGFWSLLFLGNFSAPSLVQDYFNPNPNPFLHLWSTSFEVQAYLILSILGALLIGTRIVKNKLLGWNLVLMITCIVSIILFAMHSAVNPQLSQQDYFKFELRIWELLLPGLAIANLATRKNLRKTKLATLIALLMIVFFPVPLTRSIVIPTVVILCIFYCSILQSWNPSAAERLLLFVGDRAYSLFLIHMPVLYFAKYSPVFGSDQDRALQSVFAAGITILLAEVLHRQVEKRFLRESPKASFAPWHSPDKGLSVLLVLCFISLVSTKIVIDRQDIAVRPHGVNISGSCSLDLRMVPCYPESSLSYQKSLDGLLLLGDSHAHALIPILKDITSERKRPLAVWTGPACPFYFSEELQLSDCEQRNSEVITWLLKNPTQDIVVKVAGSSLIPARFQGDRVAYLTAIRRGLESLRSSVSGKVVFILPNPELKPTTLPNMGKRYLRENLSPNAFFDKEFFKYNTPKGVIVIDSIERFCSTKDCYSESLEGVGKDLADLSHLSNSGTKRYSESLNHLFRKNNQ
jgi:peptidoglycan/LPS O-acetylase OafA/YrhL